MLIVVDNELLLPIVEGAIAHHIPHAKVCMWFPLDINQQQMLSLISSHSIMIAPQAIVMSHATFPWSCIRHIIHYQCTITTYTYPAMATSLIEQKKLQICVITTDTQSLSELAYSSIPPQHVSDSIKFSSPLPLLCSTSFITIWSACHTLLNTANITFISRETCQHVTMVVDGEHAIVMQSMDILLDSMKIRTLINTLAKSYIRYDTIYLLIIDTSIPSSSIQPSLSSLLLSPSFLQKYRTLLVSLHTLPLHVHIIWCTSQYHATIQIIRIIKHVGNTSEIWGKDWNLWKLRTWMKQEEIPAEHFLASFPSISPFLAQMILYGVKLTPAQFLNLTSQQVLQQYPYMRQHSVTLALTLAQTNFDRMIEEDEMALQQLVQHMETESNNNTAIGTGTGIGTSTSTSTSTPTPTSTTTPVPDVAPMPTSVPTSIPTPIPTSTQLPNSTPYLHNVPLPAPPSPWMGPRGKHSLEGMESNPSKRGRVLLPFPHQILQQQQQPSPPPSTPPSRHDADVPVAVPTPTNIRRPLVAGECWHCHAKGHYAAGCPNRGNRGRSGGGSGSGGGTGQSRGRKRWHGGGGDRGRGYGGWGSGPGGKPNFPPYSKYQ